MRVAKLRVGILRVEVWASTWLVRYFRPTCSLPSASQNLKHHWHQYGFMGNLKATVRLRSLAYKVATALKLGRNAIKNSRSCRPWALGSMIISEEAAREGGRSKIWTCFSKIPYGKKLPNLYQSSGVIGSVKCPTKNCWENCSMLRAFRVVFQQVSGAQKMVR